MYLKSDVCIVGGGPAGVLLGYLLAKRGISTIIIERSSSINREFRGEHVNSETEELLKEHDLLNKIEEQGLLKMEKVEYYSGKQIVKTIEPISPEDHVGIHIPQPHFLKVLIQESKKYQHYQYISKATVTELLQNGKGQYSGVKAKIDGQEWTIESTVVVGADGRYSTVRRLAEIPVTKRTHGYDVLWTKVPAPPGWEPTTRMLLVDGHQLALFTRTGGKIQIGWNIQEGGFSSLKKTPLNEFLRPLIESFPQLKETVMHHIYSWDAFVCLKVQSSLCETWVKDGLVLIGDAVHTMTPTGAIGINCALKDSHVLAPLLIKAIHTKDVRAERLKSFEEARRTEIEQQQEMQVEKELSFSQNFN